MSLTVNNKNIVVRLILGLIAVVMVPVGCGVLWQSFTVEQPHIFVMLIFSGSLTILVGLACLVGLVSSFWPPAPAEEPDCQEDDEDMVGDRINDSEEPK